MHVASFLPCPSSLLQNGRLFCSGRGDLLVYQEHAATSSPGADPFTSALDHPRLLSLPDHPHAVPDPRWKIPPTAWATVLQRVEQGEPLRHIARDYGVCRMRWSGGYCVPRVAAKWDG
jgi:hypothetical protein